MPSTSKKIDFFTSEEGIMAARVLDSMVLDDAYMTNSSFSTDTQRYADHQIPFTDKHMSYLRDHPKTNPSQYLSNLKLITKIKR